MSSRKKYDKTMRIDISPETSAQIRAQVTPGAVRPGLGFQPLQHLGPEAPFYKLLESIYDAVLVTSRTGKISLYNERATSFFLAQTYELDDQNIINLISGATASLLETINQNLIDHKYTLVEARCKRLDGTSFAAEIAVNKINLDDRGQLCFLIRDITIRQQEQRALQDAVERLEAHDRMRMEFVSNVSHELRTPLTSMIYAVSNMLRGVVGPMPEKAMTYLERLQSDCQRLLATVNDILDLHQIENQTLMLTKTIVPLGPIIREGAETLQVQADSKHIDINFCLGERELFCLCDAQKLERVILNIVGNAVKFTPANGKIDITLVQHPEKPKYARLTVADNGEGIPPDVLPKIAQRYFRVGDHVCGTGLGLSISHEIIDLHGGTIDFESPVAGRECGTAVHITLPLATKPLVIAFTQDAETTDFLRQRIMAHGYGLLLTDQPQSVLTHCLERQPAVLILDRRATEVDLRELILSIRENPKTKRLPVIVLGIKDIPRQESDLYRHFGIYYSPPPWRDQELARCMANAVLGNLR